VDGLKDCKRITLDSDTVLKSFDCGDSDLNDFLSHDSYKYRSDLLAVTYLYEFGNATVAFFSVANDKISHEDTHFSNKEWNEFRKVFCKKKLRGYPAVKICRLGVHKEYQRKNIGTHILDFIKVFFLDKNKTGCRYITVDAYNKDTTINYYLKNGFKFLTEKDSHEKTRLMYFDLIWFISAIPSSEKVVSSLRF
jgi:GNAT superfamily N-acetyltransferase